MKFSNEKYFKSATEWDFDRVEAAKLSANRWFAAFMGASLIIVLLSVAVITLVPLKKLVPVVIHQNTKTGEVWVDRPSTNYIPETQAQTQADLTRYITVRESYSAQDINQRFHLAMLLSNSLVAEQYEQSQANSNKASPVNVLGQTGTRTVRVEDIVFLDKENTHEVRHFQKHSSNLAKVDFVTTTTDNTGKQKTEYWVATIGWIYRGLPDSQQDAWDNWNGFTVTTYRVDPRNIISDNT